jgi:hypothetical protein
VTETTVKRIICCRIQRIGRAMGQVYQYWWTVCREINASFSGSNITCFTFYINLWPMYWIPRIIISTNGCHEVRVCIRLRFSKQDVCLWFYLSHACYLFRLCHSFRRL